jgi:hypothetical protein
MGKISSGPQVEAVDADAIQHFGKIFATETIHDGGPHR